ncbi:hypothetical protein [uncultured Flavobacterium sp.]|uniref:ATP-grasp domain-containing protein n=1 Tax=uncultured Flavobacterium sp. TaxID=165435 RepID=UPI0025DC8E34|nr:hypothetical protein [uncultured Flavobacterium sp.]
MKIAIHDRKNSFSEEWIEVCKEKSIPYKVVNCYDNDIVEQVSDCSVLLWHHHHANPKDLLFARQLLSSLQQAGKTVFPDHNTGWHFDDKAGQKYLLEALGLPLVPTTIFYSKDAATKWANAVSFPKVFKLRGGAGSFNVKLMKDRQQALKYINIAFGKGFSTFFGWSGFTERIRKYRKGQVGINEVFKGAARMIYPPKYAKTAGREQGYIYFQEFIPENDCDIRVVVMGDKAIAIKRQVRDGDFRASGSGMIVYDKNQIPEECVKLSFEANEKLQSQCTAFDFVFLDGKPLIVEISYGFSYKSYKDCPGYWDSSLNWHDAEIEIGKWIIESVLKN